MRFDVFLLQKESRRELEVKEAEPKEDERPKKQYPFTPFILLVLFSHVRTRELLVDTQELCGM